MNMQKNCSNCGKGFDCGAVKEAANGAAELSCWCTELPHVGVVSGPDQDCLCPECLNEAIRKLVERRGNESNRDKVPIVTSSD